MMKKYFDTFLLFGSLALLVMWVDQFLYKGVDMKDSYFFLMFAMSGFLLYLYRRGKKKMEDDSKEAPESKKNIEATLKAGYGKKKNPENNKQLKKQ